MTLRTRRYLCQLPNCSTAANSKHKLHSGCEFKARIALTSLDDERSSSWVATVRCCSIARLHSNCTDDQDISARQDMPQIVNGIVLAHSHAARLLGNALGERRITAPGQYGPASRQHSDAVH